MMSSSSAPGYRVKNNTRKKPSHPIPISPYLGRYIVPQELPKKSLLMTAISTRFDMENQAFDFTPDTSNRSSLVLSDAIPQQTNMSSFVQYADLQQAVNLNPASAATLFYNSYGKRNISRSDGSLGCGGGEYEDAPSLQDNLSNLAISMPPIYSSQVLLPDYAQNSSSMGCIGEDEVLGAMAGQWGLHHHYSTVNADPTGWIDPSVNGSGFGPKFSNELALTLATSQPSVMSIEAGQCSDIASSDRTSGNSEDLSISFGSYRAAPTPQFSQAILGSSYLAAVQEILAQIASFTLENVDHRSSVGYLVGSSSSAGTTTPSSSASSRLVDSSVQRRRAAEAKKAKLLALLQMVDDRYNQCVDEIHTVISAFHAATELDPQIHARFALQTISFLYKGLRERISTQCLAMGDASLDNAVADSERSFETEFIHKQWALQQMKKKEHQLWRPQRGLPEKSVAVLRAWMFQNFLHPYPKDAEKHLLAIKSGLTRNQVSNWFINARVRLWKPMIEEMYSEMNKSKSRRNENNDNNQISLTSCSIKNNSLLRYNM